MKLNKYLEKKIDNEIEKVKWYEKAMHAVGKIPDEDYDPILDKVVLLGYYKSDHNGSVKGQVISEAFDIDLLEANKIVRHLFDVEIFALGDRYSDSLEYTYPLNVSAFNEIDLSVKDITNYIVKHYKPLSDDQKEKISKSNKGRKLSEEHKRKIAERSKELAFIHEKPISIIEIESNLILPFDSIGQAFDYVSARTNCTKNQFDLYLVEKAKGKTPVKTRCEELKKFTAVFR